MKRLSRLAVLAVAFALPVAAARGAAPVKAKAKLTKTPDGYFLDFGRGRVAQLFVGTLPPITYKSSLQLTETTCGGNTADLTCDYEAHYGMNKVNWLWLRNPDPKLVGQPITYKRKATDKFRTMDGNIAFRTFYGPLRHSPATPPELDTLACSRFDWIPAAAAKKALITTWYSSNMASNSETDTAENRALIAVIGVHYRLGKNVLTLTAFDEAQTFGDFFINPFLYDQQSMIFRDGDRDCQVNWVRHLPASETKKYFAEQMRPIEEEKPVPLRQTDFFTANQLKAATLEFTAQEIYLR